MQEKSAPSVLEPLGCDWPGRTLLQAPISDSRLKTPLLETRSAVDRLARDARFSAYRHPLPVKPAAEGQAFGMLDCH